MIAFPKTITIEACEKFISDIYSGEKGRTLLLPIESKSYAFGGLATAIQAVNTWVRPNEKRMIQLRSSNSENEKRELINRPHKFVAAMSAKRIFSENEPNNDLRKNINLIAKKAIEDQAKSKFGQQRGGLCWFGFVDHSSKGFDPNFYNQNNDCKHTLRQPDQFQSIIKSMVDSAVFATSPSQSFGVENLNNFSQIFFELFSNTHEHGTRSENRSDWLTPGVRIIYVQSINLTGQGTQGIIKNQPMLSEYIEAVPKNENINKKRFVEVSLIDSGLGYCNRWLSDNQSENRIQNISILKEYEIFKECFKFRQSSTPRDNKGHGLPVVMDKLTKLRGFMRVRSGRLSLYRDFIKHPYSQNDDCIFFDWNSRKSAEEAQTIMGSVTGVGITLLIPLEAK